MMVASDGSQVRRAGVVLAALVGAAAACGGGQRTSIDSPLDARRVAPAERDTPTSVSDGSADADKRTAAPPSTDAAFLASDAAPPADTSSPPGDGAGAALWPAGSPGTVELRLVLPAGGSYCHQRTLCDSQSHIEIQDLSGRPVTAALPYCPITCNSFCAPPPCPEIACVPMGIAYTGEQRIWDGQVHSTSVCGMNTTCYQARYLPAGRYLAVMCATPGRLTGSDGGAPTCQATGPRQCIEIPFDLPSAAPVVGHLP
jgi:hypothetical protein